MTISNISARVRIACGVALMVLAYSPVFFDFFQVSDPSSFEVCSENVSQKCEETTTFNALQSLREEESLCNELLRNSVNYSALFPVEAAASKSDFSSLKTITKGEFAGAKVVKSRINSNFYTDARRLGVPARVVDSVIHTLSSKIDFRRSLRKGSEFEIIFDIKKGLLYSRISTGKKTAAIYGMSNGKKIEYFFEDGTKVATPMKSTAFGQPLYGRLSVTSKFGMRRHPILGTWKLHTGVDLKANYGSPVMAIYDGVVTRASHYSGYGRCVDIKHASGYVSRYAHLSRCDVRVGKFVKKGTVIGRVGSSGFSTGSHLHLELARNNKFLNPLNVKMMPVETSTHKVKNMRAFNDTKNYVKRLMAKAEH
ncbi:MAG: M23 family metallopeptidase [Alphaproteobacteria bacterium]|nr:M23 family metallopeptidase [Alphaproteobacteria bacterium]